LLTDVDGVLTDGGMYYSAHGDVMKKFNSKDGMGINILRKKNIPTIIVTKEKTEIVKKWARKMNVKKVYDGVLEKELILEKICKFFKISEKEIAFIGDDVNDLELMKKVGFSVTPKDGNNAVKKIVDYITKSKGGEGAVREITDLIVKAKYSETEKLY
jgi:YrbI family 3-deoxy-D-manno-octulosonate 8-phosphate phosphatase